LFAAALQTLSAYRQQVQAGKTGEKSVEIGVVKTFNKHIPGKRFDAMKVALAVGCY